MNFRFSCYVKQWEFKEAASITGKNALQIQRQKQKLLQVMELKKQHPEYQTILHSDQGSVYASKNYNDLPGSCDIIHSMSRAGTPTDNAAMESINGWIKSELFTDFHLRGENIQEEMEAYIKFLACFKFC